MAKKNRKILPKNSKADRPNKSTSKSPVQKNRSKESKKTKGSKSVKKPIKKSTQKTKKITKLPPKKGGFYQNKNNFNYIRSLLWQKHKGDFASYFDPSLIRIVREIFNDCKAVGINCTEQVILEKYSQLRSDDKRPKPYVLPYFFEPRLYYEIKDVPFPTLAPYLYVVSPMILPYPHEFRITEYYKKKKQDSGNEELDITGYDKFFAEWVNWCNAAMRNEHGNDYGSEELEICFKMTEAEYNSEKKRWETFIYICTPSGKIESFGYKPEQGFDKTLEPEYKIPSQEVLSEEPIEEKEKAKAKRITKKQKINDALSSWNDFFSSVKKSQEKIETENYAKQLQENIDARKEIEKLIRKYNRKKDTKNVKKLEKEFDKLVNEYIKLINKRKK
ncbi:MAG: hypothetical protein QXO70_04170 [Candidatus Pacearchaeota archaeon]